MRFADLSEKYLKWCERNRSKRTHEICSGFLKQFNAYPGISETPVMDMKPYHVQEWIDSHGEAWGHNYRGSAISAIKCVYNWADNQGYISGSPLKKLKIPAAKRRETYVTLDDYDLILRHVKYDDPFRDFILFGWGSGARPQETRHIEAKHFNAAGECIRFPADESKGKKYPRVIYLQGMALDIVSRLCAKYPDGKIFRNTEGNAWTKPAVCGRFRNLQKATGRPVIAYGMRHSFCQRLLEKDVSPAAAQALMGHRSPTMVMSVYSHMDKATQHLKDSLNRIG